MIDKKITSRANELERQANELYSSLVKIRDRSKKESYDYKLSQDEKELIDNTALNWKAKIMTKEEAIAYVENSIITIDLGEEAKQAQYIHKRIMHTNKILDDEINIYKKKIEKVEERIEHEAPTDSKNKIPMTQIDKIQIGALGILILILFVLEVFSLGETLRNNYLFFSDNATWAYALGLIFGIGGIAIKYWSMEEEGARQENVKKLSIIMILIGSIIFVISIFSTQLTESDTSTSLFNSNFLSNVSSFSWSSLILIGFTFISFGALQIFFGNLTKKLAIHGAPVTKIYVDNEQYKDIDNEIAKYLFIKGIVDKSYQVYLEIVTLGEVKKKKYANCGVNLLFERYRKQKELDEHIQATEKI